MNELIPIATRPSSLTEMVQDAIRAAIVGRQLSPGDRLTEAALARQLAVSKTPVREALLRLEHIGLIEPDAGRGGRVITPTTSAIRSAYEVRMGLETQVVRNLAEREDANLTVTARQDAEQCLAGAESGDSAQFREYDRQFHIALAVATDNPMLERLVRDTFDLTWTLRDRETPGIDDSVVCAHQHITTLDAIQQGEPELAEREMRAHLDNVLRIVLFEFDHRAHR